MNKLSPAYRNDSASGLSPYLQSYLDEEYLQQVPRLLIPNPKILVVFSAGNAMGKSALAQKISHELRGLVLENDGVKRALLKKMPSIDNDQLNLLTWQYTMGLYARLGSLTPNGLIVRDGVIDWYFDRILPIFKKQGYQLFIIAYDLSLQKRIDLIEHRGNTATTSAQRLITIIKDHETHMARFRAQYTPNITLTDDTIFDHDTVIEKLKVSILAAK